MLETLDNLHTVMTARFQSKRKKALNFARPLTTLENGSTPSFTALFFKVYKSANK